LSTLFTTSKSWHETTWLYEQLCFASSGDSILLTQDAVLALQSPLTLASFVAKCHSQSITVRALKEDLQLRGIDNQYTQIELVDYSGFVDLVERHNKQISW